MSVTLNVAPNEPLVDQNRRITKSWMLSFLTGAAWTALIDLATEVTGILAASHGGTGRASLTAHDVLVGNGTSAVGLIAPGTAGGVLTSNGPTADPSFQTLAVTSLYMVVTVGGLVSCVGNTPVVVAWTPPGS